MPPFDPFTATFEEAEAAHDAYAEPRGAVSRWCGAQALSADRAFYEAHPLDGVALCVMHDLAAPDWLARAFLKAYRKVTHYKVRTLDEAFNAGPRKSVNLAAARARVRNLWVVVGVVNDFRKKLPDEPISSLWDAASATGPARATGELGELARRLGVGRSAAQELYGVAVQRGHLKPQAGANAVTKPQGRAAHPTISVKLAGIRRKL